MFYIYSCGVAIKPQIDLELIDTAETIEEAEKKFIDYLKSQVQSQSKIQSKIPYADIEQ